LQQNSIDGADQFWGFNDSGAVFVEVNPAGQVMRTWTFPVGCYVYRIETIANLTAGDFSTYSSAPIITPAPILGVTSTAAPVLTPAPEVTPTPAPPLTPTPTSVPIFVLTPTPSISPSLTSVNSINSQTIIASIALAAVAVVVVVLVIIFYMRKRISMKLMPPIRAPR